MRAYRLASSGRASSRAPGEIDRAALDEYRAMLGALRDAGIEPMVTLHHFTLPAWLARARRRARRRLRRAPRVASRASPSGALGDLCRLWITDQRAERPRGARLPARRVAARRRRAPRSPCARSSACSRRTTRPTAR